MTGLSPSRTGLLAQTLWRSPGSRAHCVLTCLDSSTTPCPAATRDITRLADVAFPLTEKGRHPVACFRSSIIPPASPLSTLRCDTSRNHRQDSRPEWSRFSFSVGLSHPLQCAGLSRRSLSPVFWLLSPVFLSPVFFPVLLSLEVPAKSFVLRRWPNIYFSRPHKLLRGVSSASCPTRLSARSRAPTQSTMCRGSFDEQNLKSSESWLGRYYSLVLPSRVPGKKDVEEG